MLETSRTLLAMVFACAVPFACAVLAPSTHAQTTFAPDAIAAPVSWRKQVIEPGYRAEGANVGDFDRDGKLDFVFGAFWYRGPDFRTKTRIHPGGIFPIGLYSDRFFAFVDDFDADGWPDVLTVGLPGQNAFWYRNPGKSGSWTENRVATGVGIESPAYVDLDRDGVRELVCAIGGRLVRCVPDRSNPRALWTVRVLDASRSWGAFTHGLGAGDINGDGRLDLLHKSGWLEQPKSLAGDPAWKAHAYVFSPHGGAQMHAVDLDGDGDRDVVSSFHAHGWGLAWYEQIRVNGAITFTPHVILPPQAPSSGTPRISQLHAVEVGDFDRDGVADIVTGKTFWAHNGLDPGARDAAEIWIFHTRRSARGVRFDPVLVDGDSGVGRQLVLRDVNGDGRLDLIVGNKKGGALHFAQN